MGNYNSSELARQVAEKLKLGHEKEMVLYNELSQVPNGPVKDAIAALVASSPLHKYVAFVKGSCVRDAQYAVKADADLLDDDAWLDAQDAPLYVGIYEAETEIRARQMAAIRERVDADVIGVIEV